MKPNKILTEAFNEAIQQGSIPKIRGCWIEWSGTPLKINMLMAFAGSGDALEKLVKELPKKKL